MYCEFCDGVEEPQLLDVNGVQGSKSGSNDVCWCHAYGDTSWPCPAKAAEEHAAVERLRKWERPAGFPEVVCLCGSTRFMGAYNEARKSFTYAGLIVLSVEIVTTQSEEEDPQHVDPDRKLKLDELHKRKIDLADIVFVLNVDGYIGESTRAEIEYAKAHGKMVVYLEDKAAKPTEGK